MANARGVIPNTFRSQFDTGNQPWRMWFPVFLGVRSRNRERYICFVVLEPPAGFEPATTSSPGLRAYKAGALPS